ncbi:hypothetical protein Zmor_026840 [Zophobas morio]|uniref:Uncharacterized protein n=1 Tax=Zophobas morio TaxID=2755281 RepID=A0AA38M5U4_9CUCU|nr:hypothetical protein Zmor_026840 [Zophobas morio]
MFMLNVFGVLTPISPYYGTRIRAGIEIEIELRANVFPYRHPTLRNRTVHIPFAGQVPSPLGHKALGLYFAYPAIIVPPQM